jgi:hypothetical protein
MAEATYLAAKKMMLKPDPSASLVAKLLMESQRLALSASLAVTEARGDKDDLNPEWKGFVTGIPDYYAALAKRWAATLAEREELVFSCIFLSFFFFLNGLMMLTLPA